MFLGDRQMHLGLKKEDAARYVLLPGDPGRCARIAEYLSGRSHILRNREFESWAGELEGQRVLVVSTGIGGPSAAIAVEELVELGADTFIRIGTCGGISLKVRSGDIVIASGAVRQEGTTLHYMPIEFPAIADFDVLAALCDTARGLEYRHHIGVVQSKDSFYGQHRPEAMPVAAELLGKWEAWKKGHVLASEMETAAVFVTASVLGARAGSVLSVIWNPEREKAGLPPEETGDAGTAISLAVEALRLLIRRDGEGLV